MPEPHERAAHLEFADVLRDEVYSGIRGPGELLPANTKLAADYQVPLRVVRETIRYLIDEGVLISRGPGKYSVRDRQASTVAALRRLLVEAGELLEGPERRGRPEVRAAIGAWRERARAAGAAV